MESVITYIVSPGDILQLWIRLYVASVITYIVSPGDILQLWIGLHVALEVHVVSHLRARSFSQFKENRAKTVISPDYCKSGKKQHKFA